MKIYNYSSYEEYVNAQIEGNTRKIKNSYVDPNSIDMLVKHLHTTYNLEPNMVLCHGTRRGLEQSYFQKAFSEYNVQSNVIGTEISPTASEFPNTIQWDFHNVKDDWVGNVDLVYSNSFDHSFKPVDCLDAWMSCLTKNGKCVIEYSTECDTKSGKTDPFAATLDEYREFIERKYVIDDIITNKGLKDDGLTYKGLRYFIIISNK